MKGNKKIVDNFNRLLINELTAANQYFLHSGIYKHLNCLRLYDVEYQESLDEMQHANNCLKRILFLEGLPIIQNFNLCRIGHNVEEILRFDLDLENNAVSDLRECIIYADSVHDFVSRDIMVKMLKDEEKHINFLESEIELMTRVGIQNYLQSQL